jgi:CDP-paratose 2-epimerase
MDNSSSLLELFSFLEKELDVKMEYVELPVRESDQKMFVADLSKAKELIDWEPKISKEEGIRKMIEWVNNH